MKLHMAKERDTLEGTTYAQLVKEMRTGPWVSETTNKEYMASVARRVKIQFGVNLNTASCRVFLLGLEALDLVTLEDTE